MPKLFPVIIPRIIQQVLRIIKIVVKSDVIQPSTKNNKNCG